MKLMLIILLLSFSTGCSNRVKYEYKAPEVIGDEGDVFNDTDDMEIIEYNGKFKVDNDNVYYGDVIVVGGVWYDFEWDKTWEYTGTRVDFGTKETYKGQDAVFTDIQNNYISDKEPEEYAYYIEIRKD